MDAAIRPAMAHLFVLPAASHELQMLQLLPLTKYKLFQRQLQIYGLTNFTPLCALGDPGHPLYQATWEGGKKQAVPAPSVNLCLPPRLPPQPKHPQQVLVRQPHREAAFPPQSAP